MVSIKRAATYVPKGGVGKTTSASHIGVSSYQDHDEDVVFVDLAGAQNDLATQFGLSVVDSEDDAESEEDHVIDVPISAVFGDHWDTLVETIDDPLSRMTVETGEGPDLIPADSGLGGADNNLASVPLEARFEKLDPFVDNHLAKKYDLVIFDLPGAENNISLNGLSAAGTVVAPLKPGKFERDQLDTLVTDLARIREEAGHDVAPSLEVVIPTMINEQQNVDQKFLEGLQAEYPDRVTEPVVDTQGISNDQWAGRTLFAIDEPALDTAARARETYRTITTDLLENLESR